MTQFTTEELKMLKSKIARFLEADNPRESLISIYYTSFDVLQYLRALGAENVKSEDLQFWTTAKDKAIFMAQEAEAEFVPMFQEAVEFEDSVMRARHMCFHPYGGPNRDIEYYALLQKSAERRKHYYALRRLAGIYLDILASNPEDEHYKAWRFNYNYLSRVLKEEQRGFAEEDEDHLSLAEMEMLLKEVEKSSNIELDGTRVYSYWHPLIERFKKMIARRKA